MRPATLVRQLHQSVSRSSANKCILDVNQATFHPFGLDTPSIYAEPFSWRLELNPQQVWAIVGPGASNFLSSVLMGRARANPSLSRTWPFLEDHPHKLLHDLVSKVAFKTRLRGFGAPSQIGEFTDYTARFGALQEEDQVTLKEHLEEFMKDNELRVDADQIQDVARRLRLEDLLERPLIGLSNGQTRRARIARALLKQPPVLILEEPFCEP